MLYSKKYQHQIIFEIPAEYSVESFKDFLINKTFLKDGAPSCSFVSTAKIEKNQLIIDVTETYNNITYEVEDYNNYREVYNASADFNKASVILKPKS